MTETTTLTADQVAAYLRDHGDFFLHRPELLELLRLPAPSGPAISLLERQASLLRERNQKLGKRLNALLDVAKENDTLFTHTRTLTLSLLESRSAEKLFRNLLRSLKEDFRSDAVSLLLYDHDLPVLGELRRQIRHTHRDALPSALKQLLATNNVVCGVLRDEEMNALFGDDGASLRSAAMVPLEYRGQLGILAIGSDSAMHFRSAMDTLFLSHIGDVLSRCLFDVSRLRSTKPSTSSLGA